MEPFYAISLFSSKGTLKSHSVHDPCIVNQPRGQFMLPMSTESRKSSPNSFQHWCLHNLEVSKVVVKGFADVLVLLLWAVLPWSASCCPSHLQTKAVAYCFIFAVSSSSMIFVSAACMNCLIVSCCTLWTVSGSPPFLPTASFFMQSSEVLSCAAVACRCLTQTVCHTLM